MVEGQNSDDIVDFEPPPLPFSLSTLTPSSRRMSIQSITIPSYETRLNPKAHTAYRIQISTPVRTWDVYRRYSDFESLVQELKSETGRDVEGEGLPGKHGWSLRRSVDDVKVSFGDNFLGVEGRRRRRREEREGGRAHPRLLIPSPSLPPFCS